MLSISSILLRLSGFVTLKYDQIYAFLDTSEPSLIFFRVTQSKIKKHYVVFSDFKGRTCVCNNLTKMWAKADIKKLCVSVVTSLSNLSADLGETQTCFRLLSVSTMLR